MLIDVCSIWLVAESVFTCVLDPPMISLESGCFFSVMIGELSNSLTEVLALG